MWHAFRTLFRGSLLGKAVGFFREVLMAALYGTSAVAGAYRAAQTAVFIPIQFFTNDALNAGFLPLYARYRKEDPQEAARLFWLLGLGLVGLSLILAVVLHVGAAAWARLLLPGFAEEELALTARLIRVMAWGVPFYFVSLLLAYLEMGNGSYTLSSLRATVQSLGLIGGMAAAFWTGSPALLAWGFTAAYLFLTALGLGVVWKKQLLPRPRRLFRRPALRRQLGEFWRAVRFLLPLPFFLQGNVAVERAVASLQGVGVVEALDYARLITETAVVLLAVPLGLAGLSELSGVDCRRVRQQLARLVPALLAVTVPVSCFLVFHSPAVLSLLYRRRNFDEASLAATAPVLSGLAVGLWAQVGGYVLIKVLNARMQNRAVLFIMTGALAANAAFNVAFHRPLGPLALGLGASLYGLVVFALSLTALKAGRELVSPLVALALLAGIYAAVEGALLAGGADGLLWALVRFVLFWTAALLLAPPLRPVRRALWERLRTR